MENKWIYIRDIIGIGSEINSLHCDTRSFDVTMSENTALVGGAINKKKLSPESLIPVDEILDFIKNLEDITGGKWEWRMLCFKGITDTMGWLKYVRMYRYSEDKFIVCNSRSEPIDWSKCTRENLGVEIGRAHV